MAIASKGTSIQFGSPTPAAIGEVVSIGGPNVSVDMIDTTVLGSADGWREFIPGLLDGGSIEIEMCLNTDNADDLKDWLDGRDTESVYIYWPLVVGTGIPTASFTALCSAWGSNAVVGDKLILTATLKITGEVEFSVTIP